MSTNSLAALNAEFDEAVAWRDSYARLTVAAVLRGNRDAAQKSAEKSREYGVTAHRAARAIERELEK